MSRRRAWLFTLAFAAASAGSLSAQTLERAPASTTARPVMEAAQAPAGTPNLVTGQPVVAIRFDQLAQAATQGGTIDIPLADGLTVRMSVTWRLTSATQTFVAGELLDGHDGEASLTAVGDTLAGRVVADGRLYVIRRVAGSPLHAVSEVDPASLPPEGPDTIEPAAIDLPPQAPVSADSRSVGADSASYVDLLVVYTAAARIKAGGTAAIQAEATGAVNNANLSLINSGLGFLFRLAGPVEIDYTESGSASTDLNRLTSVGDGYADIVHALRDQNHADVVSMMVSTTEVCGLGAIMSESPDRRSVTVMSPLAFSLVDALCANGLLSMAHEIGHNMGLAHDYANAYNSDGTATSPAYYYAYGYRVPGVARDVMAYACELQGYAPCPRKAIFSTPLRTFPGTGVLSGTVVDNATRALGDTVSIVANFRDSTCAYTVTPSNTKFWKPGGSGSITVSTTSGCAWTSYSSDTSVVPLTGTLTGFGSASLSFTVASTTVSRTVTLVVAGQTITIDQSAVLPTITFTTQPSYQMVSRGDSVSLSVAATSLAPLTYQWQKNGVNISGATATTLALTNIKQADIGVYTVVASNTAVSATSNAAIIAMGGLFSFCTVFTSSAGEGGPVFGGGSATGAPHACTGSASIPLIFGPTFSRLALSASGLPLYSASGAIYSMTSATTSTVLLSNASFGVLGGMSLGPDGYFYVTDTNHVIWQVWPGGIMTAAGATLFAGTSGQSGNIDATGTAARFRAPTDIVVDPTGVMYVTDFLNHAIRKITPAGVVTTLAGAGAPGALDGSGLAARFNYPGGIARDSSGNLFVADSYNHAIRKVTPTGVVTTFAGSLGSQGSADGTGTSASFNSPIGLTFDSAGNLFVADQGNGFIRKISPAGVVTTIAGAASGLVYGADGVGTDASMYGVYSMLFDASGNLWVIQGSSRERLRYGTPVVAPAITTHPANQTACPTCSSPTFKVVASNQATGYRWQESTDQGTTWTDVTNSTGSVTPGVAYYSGQDSDTLQIVAAPAMNGYRYRAVAYNKGGWAISSSATLTVISYEITVSPSSLTFGATKSGATLTSATTAQAVTVLPGVSSIAWTATANQPWVTITSGSGTGRGAFTVSIANPNDALGSYTSGTATITISAPTASNSPTVAIALTIKQSGQSTAPSGSFDTPADGATGVIGAIPVTGWAVDDIGVDRVEIWRNCVNAIDRPAGACASAVPGGPANFVFIGRGAFLAGARPDIETLFSTYPIANRAGWGYLMATNALPHLPTGAAQGGQGAFTLYAYAVDVEGRYTSLGQKTITLDNDHATIPFGAIDTPEQGGTIPETRAGYTDANTYPNFGWAMTQAPKCLDTTSISAYRVYIDGVPRTLTPGVNWFAGLNRADIANAYPGRCNTTSALAVYYINADALGLANGLHTIGWDVIDNLGNIAGIGSRFFIVSR